MRGTVRRADAADLDAASAALADAFSDYPWTRWTVSGAGHVDRVRGLQRLFMERVALPYGEVWVGTDHNQEVVSAAIWSRPGVVVPPTVWQEMDPLRAELEGDRFDASTAADAHVAALRPVSPHYYLGAVGTRREHQRRGFASAVLVPVLDRAAAAHVDVFLETSAADNVEFYGRLGFVTAAETTVPGGGPRVWSMRRTHPA